MGAGVAGIVIVGVGGVGHGVCGGIITSTFGAVIIGAGGAGATVTGGTGFGAASILKLRTSEYLLVRGAVAFTLQ